MDRSETFYSGIDRDIETSPIDLDIYDNTLRDGEQTPGLVFSIEDKLSIAGELVNLGVKKFEAGFASVSDYEREAIKAILNENFDADVFSLCRLSKSDVDLNHNLGIKNLTIFAPSSDPLIKTKYNNDIKKLTDHIAETIDYAKKMGMYVKFSCEDATRASMDKLLNFYYIAKESGADMISLPDTCGVGTPEKIFSLVKRVLGEIKLPLSSHCHNDFGLATANSIAAALAGAKEVQVTLNGLGERGGNTPFEEFVMALKVLYNYDLNIDYKRIKKVAKKVSQLSSIDISKNKPITGENAFCHESGSHVKSLLDENITVYEPYGPEIINAKRKIVYGKHSGISNIKYLCKDKKISIDDDKQKKVLQIIKDKSQKEKRDISEDEVLNLLKSL